ncbi:MAG: hypothetical protein HOF21_07690 [Nitrospina sp.]|jgi:hypothetical protein|nr:hypothetical protein [Nitrospina sp.]
MNEQLKTDYFLCECSFPEHLFFFFYDDKDNVLYLNIHLSVQQGIFRRIWTAIKYIFGHQSTYGGFDEIIIRPEDRERLVSVINQLNPDKKRWFGDEAPKSPKE